MKFFDAYTDFLNEDLRRETPKLFSKMSMYTLMHVLIWMNGYKVKAWKEKGDIKRNYIEAESSVLKHSLEPVNDEIMDFAILHKNIVEQNVKLIAVGTKLIGIQSKDIRKVLKSFKRIYVYWDPAYISSDLVETQSDKNFYYMIGTNYTKLNPMRPDGFYDPKSKIHGTSTISKISIDQAEELLVNAELANQAIIDDVWERRVDANPSLYKTAKKFISKKLQDKLRHIDTADDLFNL